MKFVLTAAFVCLASTAASAQNSTAPAAPAAPAAAPTAPAPAAFSLATPIEALMADPRAKAVIDARLPLLATHPAYNLVKAMNLRQVQPHSQGLITDEILTAIAADLAAIR